MVDKLEEIFNKKIYGTIDKNQDFGLLKHCFRNLSGEKSMPQKYIDYCLDYYNYFRFKHDKRESHFKALYETVALMSRHFPPIERVVNGK